MPVLQPLTSLTPTGAIVDLQQDILDALQGRTDISSAQVARYAGRAIAEITESHPFEELRTTGPQFTLTQGITDYVIDLFINQGDGQYTFNESFAIFIDFPTNSVITQMKYRTPKAIETMTAPVTQGVPAWWTRFGAFIRVGPTPNQSYTMFMRYQVKHPFSNPPQITDPIYVPTTWWDIVAYSAAMRIAVVKRWTDQVKALHDILYGDPEFINSEGRRGRPGLVAARLFQVERDQKFDTRQLGIVVPRYTAR